MQGGAAAVKTSRRNAGEENEVASRIKNMRQVLINAGISEINANGVTGFSIRRVAEACNVSCAAPYKHFKDKKDFIAAIIDYVNEQWAERQQEIISTCGDSLREQIVEVCVGYVEFLMEKPYFRSILMLKDEEFDNIYHKARGQMSSRSQKLEKDFLEASGWDMEVFRRKLQLVRALIFGTVYLCDTGEIEYSDETLANLRHNIDREFDLP